MTKRRFQMAKKKLILNEGTTRQFMKYANIKPTYVSNFLSESEYIRDEEEEKMEEGLLDEVEEEEVEMEAEPEMDADMEVEDEMVAEPEMDAGSDDAEGMVMDLLGAIKDWAQSQGVSMELEGDEEEGMEDMEAAPEGGDLGMADDVDADLEAADTEVMDDEEVIAEVTRRVARRLLRESARRK
jgi:hypothetical protein